MKKTALYGNCIIAGSNLLLSSKIEDFATLINGFQL